VVPAVLTVQAIDWLVAPEGSTVPLRGSAVPTVPTVGTSLMLVTGTKTGFSVRLSSVNEHVNELSKFWYMCRISLLPPVEVLRTRLITTRYCPTDRVSSPVEELNRSIGDGADPPFNGVIVMVAVSTVVGGSVMLYLNVPVPLPVKMGVSVTDLEVGDEDITIPVALPVATRLSLALSEYAFTARSHVATGREIGVESSEADIFLLTVVWPVAVNARV